MVYHGWKFDVTGAVRICRPSGPQPTQDRVGSRPIPARSVRDDLTYMGPDQADLPPLPNVE